MQKLKDRFSGWLSGEHSLLISVIIGIVLLFGLLTVGYFSGFQNSDSTPVRNTAKVFGTGSIGVPATKHMLALPDDTKSLADDIYNNPQYQFNNGVDGKQKDAQHAVLSDYFAYYRPKVDNELKIGRQISGDTMSESELLATQTTVSNMVKAYNTLSADEHSHLTKDQYIMLYVAYKHSGTKLSEALWMKQTGQDDLNTILTADSSIVKY